MENEQAVVGKKVLLIEDDKFMSDLLVKEFTSKGFRVKSVASGEDALKAVQEDVPDIFVLDVLLPGMSGFEVLGKIKENAVWKNIPAVFLSNMQSKEDLEKSKAYGATSYFIKALITPRTVAEELIKLLAKK